MTSTFLSSLVVGEQVPYHQPTGLVMPPAAFGLADLDRSFRAAPIIWLGGRGCRERVVEAAEAGEHPIEAGDRENTQHGVSGYDQQHPAAFRLCSSMRADQRMKA